MFQHPFNNIAATRIETLTASATTHRLSDQQTRKAFHQRYSFGRLLANLPRAAS
jgi:hypothetical protein